VPNAALRTWWLPFLQVNLRASKMPNRVLGAVREQVQHTAMHMEVQSRRLRKAKVLIDLWRCQSVRWEAMAQPSFRPPFVPRPETVTPEAVCNIEEPDVSHLFADYEPVEGKLEFKAGESQQDISIKIIDDTAYELDEDFYVELSNPWCNETGAIASDKVILGPQKITTITIIDDDEPGTLFFEKETMTVVEDQPQDTAVSAVVERKNGSKGKIECKFYTENEFAIGLASGMVELWHIEKGNNARDVGVKTRSFQSHSARIKGMAIAFEEFVDKTEINDALFLGAETSIGAWRNITLDSFLDAASDGTDFKRGLYPDGPDKELWEWIAEFYLSGQTLE